jgi:hypothetical protein
MRVDMSAGHGSNLADSQAIQYEVFGLPSRDPILIRDMRATGEHGRWRVSRRQGEWEGDYESAEAALAALEAAALSLGMECPTCHQPMRRDETLPGFMCDTRACANARGGGAWRDNDPFFKWIYNTGQPAERPVDFLEWIAIARKRFGPTIRVEFVWRESGRWIVETADLAMTVGATAPPDVRVELADLLRAAGKPIA